mmetsp:Transcript_91003/g.178102  ORF Transcript_91003/g.178102 Transcript_91003/m.178102 type:complete len:97 (+) Transcript_91003:156-446(+)
MLMHLLRAKGFGELVNCLTSFRDNRWAPISVEESNAREDSSGESIPMSLFVWCGISSEREPVERFASRQLCSSSLFEEIVLSALDDSMRVPIEIGI